MNIILFKSNMDISTAMESMANKSEVVDMTCRLG